MIWNREAETLDTSARAALQLERLRQTVAWATERVPLERFRSGCARGSHPLKSPTTDTDRPRSGTAKVAFTRSLRASRRITTRLLARHPPAGRQFRRPRALRGGWPPNVVQILR